MKYLLPLFCRWLEDNNGFGWSERKRITCWVRRLEIFPIFLVANIFLHYQKVAGNKYIFIVLVQIRWYFGG